MDGIPGKLMPPLHTFQCFCPMLLSSDLCFGFFWSRLSLGNKACALWCSVIGVTISSGITPLVGFLVLLCCSNFSALGASFVVVSIN
jgi:hypothetical protein